MAAALYRIDRRDSTRASVGEATELFLVPSPLALEGRGLG